MNPSFKIRGLKCAEGLILRILYNQSILKTHEFRVVLESDPLGWIQRALFFPETPDPDRFIVLHLLAKTSVLGRSAASHTVSCDCLIWRKTEDTPLRGSRRLAGACSLYAWEAATAQGLKMFMGEQHEGLKP